MTGYDPSSYDKKQDVEQALSREIRSVDDLKKSLMRRALRGHSRHSPEQMQLLILWRLASIRGDLQVETTLKEEFKKTNPALQAQAVAAAAVSNFGGMRQFMDSVPPTSSLH